MPRRASATEPYALMNTSSYFRLRHSRSMKMLSRNRPLPSMLIRTPAALQLVQERGAGELHALIGVEDFRLAMSAHRFLQRLDAEVRLHGDRQPPRQNPPAEPVHHRHQIHKPFGHRNIRDVGAPDLVRPVDDQTPQQIRVHLVIRMASGWCWASGRSPPAPSPASAAGPACGSPASPRAATPPPSGAIHRTATPDAARPSAASPPDHPGSPAPAGNTASSARPSAAGIAPRPAGPGHHGPPAQAVRPAHGPDLLRKKSRSTVSWPIFSYNGAI